MSGSLPNGWIRTTLGEVIAPSRKRALPSESPELPYVGLENIEPNSMRLISHGSARDVRSSCLLFSTGDILYGRMRPYLNKVWVADFGGICSAEFLVFRQIPEIDARFLAQRLNADDFVTFANDQVSGERPRVDFEKLSRFQFLLPPLREQREIAEKVAATLSRIARAESATRRAQERLKNYRAAVLQSAVTGDFSEDWRKARSTGTTETVLKLLADLAAGRRAQWEQQRLKQFAAAARVPPNEKWKDLYSDPIGPNTTELPELPNGWMWIRLQQVSFVLGGLTKNPRRKTLPLKLPYLTVANVYANRLRLDDVATIGVEPEEIDRLLLQKGDLLVVEGNGSKDQIGRVAIWDGSIERCLHQNHIIKVRLVDATLGQWILIWLLSPTGRHYVEKVASSTTGLYTLSISKVEDLPIPLVPVDEQAHIIREVGTRLSASDRLAKTLQEQLERSSGTKASLLREAFEGRLIPQDPQDEPAAVLLSKIKASQYSDSNKLKVKNMPRAKSTFDRRPLLTVLRESTQPMTPEQLFRESGYQHEFEQKEFRQEVVDRFYEELRSLVEPDGLIVETRPDRETVLLETKS